MTLSNTAKKHAIALGIGIVTAFVAVNFLFDPRPNVHEPLFDLDAWCYDRLVVRGFSTLDDSIPEVFIAAFDEDSFSNLQLLDDSRLAQWPWSPELFAQAIDRLKRLGVAVVGIDKLFVESHLLNPENDLDALETVLAAACRNHGRVVLAEKIEMDSIDDISEIQTLVTPRPVLLESANTGIISLPVDPDGMLRLGYGAHSHQDVMYPAFATEIVRLYRRLHENDIHYKENSFTLGERRVPLRHGTFYINYSGERIEQLPFFLFVDPLFDLFSDTYFSGLKPGDEENPFDIKRLENSIVLMGATTGDLHDEYLSPISPSPIPGVEVHAHIINTLLSGRFLYHVNDSLQIWGTFFLSILLCAVCSISSIRTGILVSILGISCWVEGGAIAFLLGGYVVRLVTPPVCLILAVLATITYRYIFEEREKRYLKSLFSQATDSVLVDRLLDYPDAVKLGGDRRRITILFSDIRSFSTLSETMDPHDLVDFLNHYFTAVTDVIFKNNGMIDKFIGDAVMAIFGAPLPDEDHAYRACKTAVEMLEVQKQLSKARESEGSPPFRIGVGIHTGEVILGNLGSEKRSNYTCIGDAVNVASRIEGLNKTFYTELLISMDTCQECSQFLNVRPVGSSEIRGRKEKVELFELLSLKTPDAPG